MCTDDKEHTIYIVGAGIAGIYAAYILKKKGWKKICILEASNRVGGRIRPLTGFANFPLELGAENIHGRNSVCYEFMEYTHAPIHPKQGHCYYYYKNAILHRQEALKVPVLKTALQFFEYQRYYYKDEMTVAGYLKNQPYYPETAHILESFSLEYGTTSNKLGMYSLAVEEAAWASGEQDYRLDQSFLAAFDPLIDEVKQYIQFNTQIKVVDYQTREVILFDQHQKSYRSNFALLTLPLAVLKRGDIFFTPALPDEKITAITALGMDDGLKIFLKFKKAYWAKDMEELIGGTICSAYLNPGLGKLGATPVLTAYIMGDKASTLKQYHRNKIIRLLVAELDEMFGNSIASRYLEDAYIMDWGASPFISGAYSFPGPHTLGAREKLARPLKSRLFFAGEATNCHGHASTVHGAMESAEQAVAAILQAS